MGAMKQIVLFLFFLVAAMSCFADEEVLSQGGNTATTLSPSQEIKVPAGELPKGRHIVTFRGNDSVLLGGTMIWDTKRFSGTAFAQVMVSHQTVSYGIKLDAYDVFNVVAASAYGGFLVRSFYSKKNFSGISAQLGAGAYLLNGVNSSGVATQGWAPSLWIAAGWRFVITRHVTVGILIGLVYASIPADIINDLNGMTRTRSQTGLDLGFSF
jgi:hypothetical protein